MNAQEKRDKRVTLNFNLEKLRGEKFILIPSPGEGVKMYNALPEISGNKQLG